MNPLIIVLLIIFIILLIFGITWLFWILLSMTHTSNQTLTLSTPTFITQGIGYQATFGSNPSFANDIACDINWSQIKTRKPYDLDVFNEMHVSALRIYGWNFTLSHALFIQDISTANIQCQFAIPNFIITNTPQDIPNFWKSMLNEITENGAYKSCVYSIAIANELEQEPGFAGKWLDATGAALQALLNEETQRALSGPFPQIVVPCANINPTVKMASLLKVPSIASIGSRFSFGLNTTQNATDTLAIAKTFTTNYNANALILTEWSYGTTPLPSNRGTYMQQETQALINGVKANGYTLSGIFGFLYFKKVESIGSEFLFGFTCFPSYTGNGNCLSAGNCPSTTAPLGIWRASGDNPLQGLASGYGSPLSNTTLALYGNC